VIPQSVAGTIVLDPGTGMAAVVRADTLDPNDVTPGVIGFAITFLVAAAVVLLLLDMTRRIRRVRYREEIAARLDSEERRESEREGRPAADVDPLAPPPPGSRDAQDPPRI